MSVPATYDISGRVAVVTGGAGLLGREHCAALLETGATVAIADVNKEAAARAAKELGAAYDADRICPVELDVRSTESIERARAHLSDRYGRVDILINNAALDPKVQHGSGLAASRLENFPLEQWHLEIDVGLTGAFLCSQVFGTAMAAGKGGVILNIASDLSVFAPDQRIYRKDGVPDDQQPTKPVTYSVIKTGLIGLSRYLATYWADRGVRVNALSPGGVYTSQPADFVGRLTNLIPMGRMARSAEYRGAVQFLCSDASSYMTGQNIVMDGGRSVW